MKRIFRGQMDSLRLIEAVKNHPELYDRKNKNYTNMEVKRDVWIAIAEEFNEPEENIRTRWRNLRDAYQKSIRRKAELEESGLISQYKKYKFEDQLHYLLPFCSTSKRRSLIKNDAKPFKINVRDKDTVKVYLKAENDDIIGEMYTEDDDFENVERLEMEDAQMDQTSIDDPKFHIIEESDTTDDDIGDEQYEQHMTDIIEPIPQTESCSKSQNTKQDQYIISDQSMNQSSDINVNFFINMAQTVNTLPLLLQARLKRQIFQLVSNAEIQHLSDKQQ